MGVAPYLLSAALRGVLAQRLVRRLCASCREEAVIGEEEAAAAGGPLRGLAGRRHWRARGCDACLEGYRGRTGLFELMVVDEAVAEAVRAGAGVTAVRRAAAASGRPALWDAGRDALLAGETSLDELFRALGREAGAAA